MLSVYLMSRLPLIQFFFAAGGAGGADGAGGASGAGGACGADGAVTTVMFRGWLVLFCYKCCFRLWLQLCLPIVLLVLQQQQQQQ